MSYDKSIFNFKEAVKLMSKVAVPFSFLLAPNGGSSFSVASSRLSNLSLFDVAHSSNHVVISHCDFNLYFPEDY